MVLTDVIDDFMVDMLVVMRNQISEPCNLIPSDLSIMIKKRDVFLLNSFHRLTKGAIQKSYIGQNVIISVQQSLNRRIANRADTQVCPYPTHLLIHDMPVGADLCVRPSICACLHHFFVLHPSPMTWSRMEIASKIVTPSDVDMKSAESLRVGVRLSLLSLFFGTDFTDFTVIVWVLAKGFYGRDRILRFIWALSAKFIRRPISMPVAFR